MDQLAPFDRHYINLLLAIDKHIDGYIDAYIGPPQIKEAIDAQPLRSPAQLLDDVSRLKETIPSGPPTRHAYLQATLRAIETTVRLLGKEDIPYMEEVQRIYDVMPQRVEDRHFLAAHNDLDSALPGSGPLHERFEAWRSQYDVPKEKLLAALQLVTREVHERTRALISLPSEESIDVELVEDEPWSAYNWFKGDGHSLIEINTDIAKSALGLLSLMAHEGYPGHHTEAALKEQHFWQNERYGEASAMLLHSPAAVIAEGIASTAVEIIFPAGQHLQWNLEVLLPAISMPARETAVQIRRIEEAMQRLRGVTGNAAILYHTHELSQQQTLEYIQTYGLSTPQRAEKILAFITHPLYRSYPFTYTEGYELIAKAAAGEDKSEPFLSCLRRQILPSQLAAQAARNADHS